VIRRSVAQPKFLRLPNQLIEDAAAGRIFLLLTSHDRGPHRAVLRHRSLSPWQRRFKVKVHCVSLPTLSSPDPLDKSLLRRPEKMTFPVNPLARIRRLRLGIPRRSCANQRLARNGL
jgi:hypothetical protein